MYALLCTVFGIIGMLFFVAILHVCATLLGFRNCWKALFRRYIACMRYFARFWELVEGMDSSLYCGNASLCRLPGPPKTLKRLSGGLLGLLETFCRPSGPPKTLKRPSGDPKLIGFMKANCANSDFR